MEIYVVFNEDGIVEAYRDVRKAVEFIESDSEQKSYYEAIELDDLPIYNTLP